MSRIYHGKRVECGSRWLRGTKLKKTSSFIAVELQIGAEPETRTALLRLLLAEEKMLGRTREQLGRIDRHIEKLRRIIDQHEKRIGRVKFVGIGSERAKLLLSTMNDLMATYQRHRQWITAEVADGDVA